MEQEKLTKMKGGKLKMASEKVEKALQMLKEEGVETNVVTDDDSKTVNVEDETTGEVGGEVEAESNTDESLVVESADSGRGVQMYRDYSKDNKFKRLSR